MDTNTPTTPPATPEPIDARVRPTPDADIPAALRWSAPIHPIHERTKRWYAIGGAVILLFAVYGILTGNWTFTLVMLLIGGTYFLLRSAPTILKEITISERGFSLDGEFTQWEDCKDFWVVRFPQYAELHLMKKKGLDREVVIQTGDTDPILIQTVLEKYLSRRSDQGERILDSFIRILKL